VDSKSPRTVNELRRRGKAAKTFPSTLICLDAHSGREHWVKRFDYPPLTSLAWLHIRANDDWVAYNSAHEIVLTGKAGQARALEAATGRELWHRRGGFAQPLIVADNWFLSQTGAKHDLLTGKPLLSRPLFRRSGGCNYAVAGKHLLFLRARCASYVELERGTEISLRNLRSGCSNSLVAAGGILSAPCYSFGCICNYPLQGSFALFHLPEADEWDPAGVADVVRQDERVQHR
jgi:hypothetical protein